MLNANTEVFLKSYRLTTGDNEKHSSLDVEFMIKPGSTGIIISYPIIIELDQFAQHIVL